MRKMSKDEKEKKNKHWIREVTLEKKRENRYRISFVI